MGLRYGARTLVERCFPVDVRRVAKLACWMGSVRYGSSSMGFDLDLARPQLMMRWAESGTPYTSTIALTTTSPNYGGRRWWAWCPRCSRRVAKLYSPPGGGAVFGCRLCLDLVHEVTREDEFSRAIRRARTPRLRVGASLNLMEPIWAKPRGMHWATFDRILERERATMRTVSACFGRWMTGMERGMSALVREKLGASRTGATRS